jgi:hypothetical protein
METITQSKITLTAKIAPETRMNLDATIAPILILTPANSAKGKVNAYQPKSNSNLLA